MRNRSKGADMSRLQVVSRKIFYRLAIISDFTRFWSVRDLNNEDELVRALTGTDRARERLSSLSKALKLLTTGKLRDHLGDSAGVWRNKVKSNLNYYLQRLLFPLKGLGVHGCRYIISLENFTNSNVSPQYFAICGKDSGFGDLVGVRSRLFSVLKTISQETGACLLCYPFLLLIKRRWDIPCAANVSHISW